MTALAVEAGTLLTPTGVVVGSAEANTADWYAARSRGVGSSDVPVLLGLSNWSSPGHLWARKLGLIPADESGEAARLGHLLEPVIAQDWATRHGTQVTTVPTLRHAGHPHHLASLDRLVERCPDGAPGGCGLEVKYQSSWKSGSWRDDVPDAYLAQCTWQLHVTGLDHMHVTALIDQRIIDRLVVVEPDVLDLILGEAEAFWAHVLAGTQPPVDAAGMLLDLLERLHPDRSGTVELDQATVTAIRDAYESAHRDEKDATERKDHARAALVSLLGDANTVTVADVVVATYLAHDRTSIDADRLQAGFPDAYEACATTKPTRPVLRWKKGTI